MAFEEPFCSLCAANLKEHVFSFPHNQSQVPGQAQLYLGIFLLLQLSVLCDYRRLKIAKLPHGAALRS